MGGHCMHFSETCKATSCMIPFASHSGKGKAVGTGHALMVIKVWGWGQDGPKGHHRRNFKAVELLCEILRWWIRNSMQVSKPTEQGELYFVKHTIMNQKLRGIPG